LIATQPSAVQPDLLTLLAEILEVRPDDALLENLRTQIETTEPGSPLWSISIKRLESQLPGYARGSYGAKLIPEEQFAKYDQTNRRLATLAQRYFASSIDSARQKALDDEIHTGVNRHPAGCMLCHTDSNGLLDFTAAGYLPERANRLKNLQLAHLMEDIRHGKQFRLPTLVEESNAK
jgi:hypothetical protein